MSPSGGDVDIQQALRSIYERLGGIDERLKTGADRHEEFAQSLAEIDNKVDKLDDRCAVLEVAAAKVVKMEETVERLDDLRIEKQAVSKRIGQVVKSGPAIGGMIGAAVTWLGQQFISLPWPK
jgi:chromosome segregation ATPase